MVTLRTGYSRASVVQYLRADHLGSTSLATTASGGEVTNSRTLYYPYGEVRWPSGGSSLPTDFTFTGQRNEAGIGLMDYHARFYDPALGRFVQADTIVPGAASSAGGGAATLGYSEQTRLTPLTVGFHETQFIGLVGDENRELLQFGPVALWDGEVRREHTVPMGPANPQALNRYSYCLGNPLRYVDPTGHQLFNIRYDDWSSSASALDLYISDINNNLWMWEAGSAIVFGFGGGTAGFFCGGPWGAGVVGAISGGAGYVTGKLLGGGFKADALDLALKYINNGSQFRSGETFEIDFQWHAQSQVRGDFWSDDLGAQLRIQMGGLSPRYIGLQAGLELLNLLGIDPASIETYNSVGEKVN
jgi:RHS repeat-associated protein